MPKIKVPSERGVEVHARGPKYREEYDRIFRGEDHRPLEAEEEEAE